MHALEKILANASNKSEIKAGDFVNAEVDMAEVNDLYLQVIQQFYEFGGKRVKNPDNISFVFDHYSPAPTIKSAENQQKMREFCQEQNIEHLFDVGKGICHQVMPESALVLPGKVLIATDSHTTTHGAFGCFGTGVGASDLAVTMLTGKLWFKVPEVIKIEVNGTLKPGVMAKDVILMIIDRLKQDGAVYKAIEFCGETVENMSLSSRMVLCNMAVEMGAKTSYIQPDEKVTKYFDSRTSENYTIYETDPDYEYVAEYNFDVSSLNPLVSLPHSPDKIDEVKNVDEKIVDQIFIGTCTGGRLEDIKAAVDIIKDKKVNTQTRLLVIPASDEVLLNAEDAGYIKVLLESGAIISTPGCGPCLGAHQGVLSAGETGITTSSRNFPGRMGSTESKLYITSPATAAASALTGELTDPSNYVLGGV
ncbi:MAG: 3-isopropylmalate dehydratase large subunit [Halanaerobiales bacterium]